MTYFSPATAFTAEFVLKTCHTTLRLYVWLLHGSLGHTLQASARWFCKNLHMLMNPSFIKLLITFREKLQCCYFLQLLEITAEETLGNWKGKYIQVSKARSFRFHLLLTLSIAPHPPPCACPGFSGSFGTITCWEISPEWIPNYRNIVQGSSHWELTHPQTAANLVIALNS